MTIVANYRNDRPAAVSQMHQNLEDSAVTCAQKFQQIADGALVPARRVAAVFIGARSVPSGSNPTIAHALSPNAPVSTPPGPRAQVPELASPGGHAGYWLDYAKASVTNAARWLGQQRSRGDSWHRNASLATEVAALPMQAALLMAQCAVECSCSMLSEAAALAGACFGTGAYICENFWDAASSGFSLSASEPDLEPATPRPSTATKED